MHSRMKLAALCAIVAFTLPLFAADPDPPRRPGPAGRTNNTARATTTGTETGETPEQDPNDPALERERERANSRLASRLTRGPYLQMGTPDSVVVRWRTDVPSANVVRFGLHPTNLRHTARSPGALTEHVVQLTNLLVNTRYFYALHTNTFTGTGTNFSVFTALTNSFITPPPVGPTQSVRIWVLGDPGTRRPVQRHVRDAFHRFNARRRIDFWMLLGDNAYQAGTDNEYQGGIFAAYVDTLRSSVLWPCLGNHDGGSASSPTQSGIYYDIFTLPTLGQAGGVMSGTEAYFSFDYANAHFVCLDSYDSDRSSNAPMARWLKNDLAANRRDWTIAYWHHPPYSMGSHDTDLTRDGDHRSDEMRRGILRTLEAGGVDLVLCGHSHALERSWFMDGHYGGSTNFNFGMVLNRGDGRLDGDGPYRKRSLKPTPHSGTVYVVAGSSGQTSGVKGMHQAMRQALNIAGSVALDINGPRLDLTFVDTNGAVRDYFTMLKGGAGPPPGPRELALAGKGTGTAKVNAALRPFLESPVAPADLSLLTNALPLDQEALLRLYQTSTNFTEKTRVTWALAAIGNGAVTKQFLGFLTNKVRGRVISAEEEDLRFATLQSLGLLAARYEPALDLLKKGISADWWYFRTNWISTRPLEQSAAILQSCTLQALTLSGRWEANDVLGRMWKNYRQFTYGEPLTVYRDYSVAIAIASNRLERAVALGPTAWRRRALTEEVKPLRAE